MAFFWVGLRLGTDNETKAPGPGSSGKEPHERVRLWDGRGLARVVVVVAGEEVADVDVDEGTE